MKFLQLDLQEEGGRRMRRLWSWRDEGQGGGPTRVRQEGGRDKEQRQQEAYTSWVRSAVSFGLL